MPATMYHLAIQAYDPAALGYHPKPGEKEPTDVSVRRRQRDADQAIIAGAIEIPMGIDEAADTS
eukprot:8907264-Heterocapsa_arctica.AAC.1